MQANKKIFFISILLTLVLFELTASITLAAPGTIGGGEGITNPLAANAESISDVLVSVIKWMLGLVGFIALIAMIIGGGRMIVDFGNEDQVKKGKMTIMWAVIGLLVVMLSYAIINIVTKDILGA